MNSCCSRFCSRCHSSDWLLQKQTSRWSFVKHRNFRHATVGFIPPCPAQPSLKGSTCTTARMIQSCSESVEMSVTANALHDRLGTNGGVQSFRGIGTCDFTESRMLHNEESSLKNRSPLLRGRRAGIHRVQGFLTINRVSPTLLSRTQLVHLKSNCDTSAVFIPRQQNR